MKLEVTEKKINYTGEMGPKYQCSISEASFIFNLLRSKIYSNPIRIVCQEILSNGRDAHREVGKEGVPIKVYLPNSMSNKWICRDFGPGITPDRMENVFVRYGASTKRGDNHQTGGFGIGAKTPWAYNDTFGIQTYCPEDEWTDENGGVHTSVMIKRIYAAFVDESRIGCVTLMSKEITDEPQGTEIIVTAKQEDFSNFAKWTKHSCDYWDTRPIVNGDSAFSFSNFDIIYEGDDWELIKYSDYSYDNSNCPLLVLDGIQYPLDIGTIFDSNGGKTQVEVENKKIIDIDSYKLRSFVLRLFFETGEIAVTANRESIDYKETDFEVIRAKFGVAIAGIRQQFIDSLEGANNLWEANVAWNVVRTEYKDLLPKIEWQGHTLCSTGNLSLYDYSIRNATYRLDSDGKIRHRQHSHINFKENSILAFQDEMIMPIKKTKVYTLLLENPGCDVQIIAIINRDNAQAVYDEFEEKECFSEMQPVKLSTVTPTPLPKQKRIIAGKVAPKLKKLERFCEIFRADGSREYDIQISLKDNDYYYVIQHRNYYYIRPNQSYGYGYNEAIDYSDISQFAQEFNTDIIVVENKDIRYLNNTWKILDDLFLQKIKSLQSLMKYEFKNEEYRLAEKGYGFYNYLKAHSEILDEFEQSDLTLIEHYSAGKIYTDNKSKLETIKRYSSKLPLNVCGDNGKLEVIDFKLLWEKVQAETPLIMFCYSSQHQFSNTTEISPEHIIEYLRMCEAKIADSNN